MNTRQTVKPPHVLLIEPDNLVRGTLAGVCRDLGLARIHQATSVSAATGWLGRRDLQGILVALDPEGAAINMLTALRAGQYACPAHLVVAVMSTTCTVALAQSLKALEVKRLLLQPFKLRDAILTLEQMGASAMAGGDSTNAGEVEGAVDDDDDDQDGVTDGAGVKAKTGTGAAAEAHPT